ncbi:unnamed protein product [Chondrus crispus]|uniref:Uncharacterized protein n=1 Tax=Chondrus crispus TaxID=2769 RepID=R7Q572_CHOCR|nr:unnamed protein product [Chondrus crispus]CDF32610.1 unnamed protein product [Chondrus crispus]|eukprot:XP_005712381.1 unnamed protein product [Chondrus crispus]
MCVPIQNVVDGGGVVTEASMYRERSISHSDILRKTRSRCEEGFQKQAVFHTPALPLRCHELVMAWARSPAANAVSATASTSTISCSWSSSAASSTGMVLSIWPCSTATAVLQSAGSNSVSVFYPLAVEPTWNVLATASSGDANAEKHGASPDSRGTQETKTQ